MMGGEGPMAIAVMWAFTALTWIFVCLRLYTRYFILNEIGYDDHAYWLSGVLLLLYTVFLNISATYGFGQSMPGPGATSAEFDNAALAVKYEMIGQTFAVIGMSVAKISLGLFLLRIVVQLWHKIAIWIAMVTLMLASVLTAVMFWVQCVPVQKIFDPLRVDGVCNINVTPYATLLGVWCALADFFFAIFPWLFIWNLNMKQRDKYIIAGSLSLGVIAGACGIVRTYEVVNGFTQNYTKDTVPLIIWSAAEMAVTLLCIGIPILRPLWRRTMYGSNLSSDPYYRDRSEGTGQSYNLDRMPQANKPRSHVFSGDSKLGLGGPSTVTRIAGDNQSDESILGHEYRGSVQKVKEGEIRVKQDFEVDWNKGDSGSISN